MPASVKGGGVRKTGRDCFYCKVYLGTKSAAPHLFTYDPAASFSPETREKNKENRNNKTPPKYNRERKERKCLGLILEEEV